MENNNYYCPVCGIYYGENEYEQYLDHMYEHDNHPEEEACSR